MTVEVLNYSASWGWGEITSESRLYTLYNNRVLVESRVMLSAEDSKLIRLLQFPTKIKRLSEEDYLRVCNWRDVLEERESELTREIILSSFLDGCWYACVYGKINHYVIPLVNAGAYEANKIEDTLRSYIYTK